MPHAHTSLLQRCHLFGSLTPAELTRLEGTIHLHRYEPGSHILTQGAVGSGLCILIDGVARVTVHSTRGHTSTLTYLSPGDACGELSIFTDGLCTADVVAVTPATVVSIPVGALDQLIAASPAFTKGIITSLAQRIRDTDKLLYDITFCNLEGRVAAKLLTLADKFGEKTPEGTRINLPITHAELADYIGTSRETVTKILSIFKKENSIGATRELIITDAQKLAAWVQGSPGKGKK